jgi:hypothetical protein
MKQQNKFLCTLKPDFFMKPGQNTRENNLELCILKITTRCARLGKDIKSLFV